jgi:low temperature requirement protein LtrA
LHLPMIAGIALVAVGLRQTLVDVSHPLGLIPAVAMIGGTSLYLLAHVAFRLRNVHRLNVQRLAVAIALPALLPAARTLPALATLAVLTAVMAALIFYESLRYAELRGRLRPHEGATA